MVWRVFEAEDITVTEAWEFKIAKSSVERVVKEELISSKVKINNALVMDEHYSFYNFLYELNAAFIRCILVTL